MRAAVSRSYGPPDGVTVEDVPTPVPGDGELLIRIRATTVSRTDCGFLRASPPLTRAFTGLRRPRQPIFGCEWAGVVEAAGPGVTRFAPGERLFGYREPRFGCHAEYVVVREDEYLARIPDGVGFEQAAAATEGAHYALTDIRGAKVRPGQRALVHGASGAIGSAAVQLLPHFGAEVVAVCGTDAVQRVRDLGVSRVIDYQVEDFLQLPDRFDLVFDAVGKSSYGACKALLTPRGIYCSTELGPRKENPALALLTPLLRRQKVIFPIPHLRPDDLDLIQRSLGDGTFRPLLDRTYPLADIVSAYHYVETGQKVGSVVITP